MSYFIGIVPPKAYKERVITFQKQWKRNTLVEVVEPHITVKAQGGLNEDKSWIDRVKEVCAKFPPFEVTLNTPMFFGEVVLFLSVISTRINALHNQLVQAVSPDKELIKRYMELDDYTPHLTLGQTLWGLTYLELKEMEERANRELTPYPTFKVDSIRIYQEIEPNKYVRDEEIPLGS